MDFASFLSRQEQEGDRAVHVEEVETEAIVFNVYSKMRVLESKYLDLATLYKDSLVDQTPGDSNPLTPNNIWEDRMKHAESKIIQDLMTEKSELQQNINNLNFVLTRALKTSPGSKQS